MNNGFDYRYYEARKSNKWCKKHYGKCVNEVIVGFILTIEKIKREANKTHSYLEIAEAYLVEDDEQLNDIAKQAGDHVSKYNVEEWNHLMRAAGYLLVERTKKPKKMGKRRRLK